MNPERPQNPENPEDTPVPEPEQAEAGLPATAEGRGGASAGPGVEAGAADKGVAAETAHAGAEPKAEAAETGTDADADAADTGTDANVKAEAADADADADVKAEAADTSADTGTDAKAGAAGKNVDAEPNTAADDAGAEPEAATGQPAQEDASAPADSAPATGTDTGTTHPAAPHSDVPPPPPRPRTALVVASVAAAVLALGGGGAWLASGVGADGEPGAAGSGATPPPLALDGWSPAPTGSTAGIAPGERNPYGVRYVAEGKLPEGPGSAPVHVPEGAVGKDAVARLARALDVAGTPVADGDGWRVGGHAGEPVLRVAGGAAGGWSFSRYAPGTDNCPKADVCAQDPIAPAADAVSVAKARQVVAPVLKALGQDDAKTDASQVMGARRVVNADPVVGGLPTYGWTTGLTVDERGELVGGHGMLAVPGKGAEYPVLSADKTLALLNSAQPDGHRMGIGGCATPVPAKDRLEQPCGTDPSPGTPKGDRLTVEKAVFGLAAHTVDGREALVPSWLYQVRGTAARGTFTVTYPAVAPEYLTTAAPSGSAGSERSVKVGAYSAHGRELTVRFMGGVCADHRAAAKESAGRVTVSVTERPRPGKVCVLMAKEFAETVRLDAPLGGRTVVTEDGGRVPEADSLARPEK
ncbi:hypothetical protein [Streptomyces sp. NPDC005435]|uniref:hypothetical protein n=1 Tax=Streptomyces sp. NPDC005435 TaxID=3154464 RepID=UPI003455CC5C